MARAIVWFRNNLRLDDNEALAEALAEARDIIPVFVFDDRSFKGSTHAFGFPKTGVHRARFVHESVVDLRERLRARGSDLVVRAGRAEDILLELAKSHECSWVYCNREVTSEEAAIQDALEHKLWAIGQELRHSRGKMLYYTADLPFPVKQTPDTFSAFRKEVERITPVREPIDAPAALPVLPKGVYPGDIPSLPELGYDVPARDERAAIQHVGGETAGLARLHHYLWGTDAAKTYKDTRNGLLGEDYSTKFSAWLAAGCLSPKRVVHEVRRYEAERGSTDGTYWIFFELLWRDYFRLIAKKYESAIFKWNGPKAEMRGGKRTYTGTPNNHLPTFERWATGTTGVPFVDANMREMNATGFMSNRGRQNVASFLVKDLKLNWQMGANYMESVLIDYDVASNWCNWNYVAGVGNDPREDRYFNILSQATRYDPNGDYIRHWLPELAALPKDRIHRPDLLTADEERDYGVKLGVDYPTAMVDIGKWAKGNRKNGRGRSHVPHGRGKRRDGRNRGAAIY